MVGEETIADKVLAVASAVPDPEIPQVSIGDLGMVGEVKRHGKRLVVTLLPSYMGCPATEMIRHDIKTALQQARLEADVELSLTPAWTTDRISDRGRKALSDVGIVPPQTEGDIACPHCHSIDTRQISAFGSTPCKSLYACRKCGEPFEYFKCHR